MKSTLTFLLLCGVATYLYYALQPGPPAPAAHRYSADDIFFLRRYVSVRTAKGCLGLLPGQEVARSGDGRAAAPGKISVTAGGDILEIERTALTHDIDEAAALQASDARLQNALQASIAQTAQTAALQTQADDAAMANGVNASSALMASQNTVGTYRTRLSDAAVRVGSGGGYYARPTVYAVAAAQPMEGVAFAGRSSATSFPTTPTVQPYAASFNRATNRFVTPPVPVRTDPAGLVPIAGIVNQ
jgi:hypothetical protein